MHRENLERDDWVHQEKKVKLSGLENEISGENEAGRRHY